MAAAPPPLTDLRLGTRQSPLALAQTDLVKEALSAQYPQINLRTVPITTRGDRDLTTPLDSLPATGYFTKELEAALLEERIDVAVHSLKDLAARTPDPFSLGAVLPRGPARDVLVLNPRYESLADLPERALILTGSVRRARLLQRVLPGCETRPLRGNIQTRLNKLVEENADALVMAEAAIRRLGLHGKHIVPLPVEEIVPAPGQGAIGLEILAGRTDLAELLQPLDDPATRQATDMERHLAALLEAGCSVPLGAHVYVADSQLMFVAAYYSAGEAEPHLGRLQLPLDADPRESAEKMAALLRAGATVP